MHCSWLQPFGKGLLEDSWPTFNWVDATIDRLPINHSRLTQSWTPSDRTFQAWMPCCDYCVKLTVAAWHLSSASWTVSRTCSKKKALLSSALMEHRSAEKQLKSACAQAEQCQWSPAGAICLLCPVESVWIIFVFPVEWPRVEVTHLTASTLLHIFYNHD